MHGCHHPDQLERTSCGTRPRPQFLDDSWPGRSAGATGTEGRSSTPDQRLNRTASSEPEVAFPSP